MPKIQVTGPVADILGPHPLSMREVFIGCHMEADGQAVAMLRQISPGIPQIPNTYEVALADALEALALKPDQSFCNRAIMYWGDTIRPYLIYVPHSSAEIVSA